MLTSHQIIALLAHGSSLTAQTNFISVLARLLQVKISILLKKQWVIKVKISPRMVQNSFHHEFLKKEGNNVHLTFKPFYDEFFVFFSKICECKQRKCLMIEQFLSFLELMQINLIF